VVRWGVGWTAGGSAADQIGPFIERVRKAWADAGREGRPRIVALSYFAMQEDRADESRANLRDYYGFLGDWADGIVEGTPRGAVEVRDTARRFEDVGVDELMFDPTVADRGEIDLLAEAVL
jgi:alkanesulfonate monooxygenase SsuD/methylene tetrahydromethanopterin reductase-like flavin-dependent oxidoreductase (luciferase family)